VPEPRELVSSTQPLDSRVARTQRVDRARTELRSVRRPAVRTLADAILGRR
jgi:hypothetical protein